MQSVIFDHGARRDYTEHVGHIAYVIPDDIHTKAKIAAAKRGISLKQWLQEAIEAQADAEEAEGQRRRRRT